MEAVTDFLFLDFKITEDGDCSHEIKRHLLIGRKTVKNLDSVLKNRDITLPTEVRVVKAMISPVPFRPPSPNVGLLLRRCSGKGLHLAMTGEPRGFSRVTTGNSGCLLCWPRQVQSSTRVAKESWAKNWYWFILFINLRKVLAQL